MTIKELEQAVGMTRANIRFYEQEGLISPRREENGYRDYSQADVETLERIKLLRRLQLGLEEIRALQNGESALSDVLAEQLKKLETDQAALDRAREVCQRLREAGTDYAALDPQPWLRELEREPVPASERFAPPVDELPPPPGHPWRRYFARALDLFLYGLPFTALWALALHLSPQTMNNALFKLFDAYVGIGVMLLLEPLLLSRWGTTPGKWLFGITVRDGDGNKLTWERARQRTWTVFAKGMGYGIPFYALWREYKSYQTVDQQERCDWERAEDGEPERMEVPDSTARCVAYVGVRLALSVLAFLILSQAAMPPHRGELTLAEFCDNWNFYNSYTELDLRPLSQDGKRTEYPENSGVIVIDVVNSPDGGTWSEIRENGETVGFRYEITYTGRFFVADYMTDTQCLGLLAYAGSLPEVNCVNFRPSGWLNQLPQYSWEYDYTYRGVRVTQQVTDEGYDLSGNVIVLPEDQEGELHLIFTVQRA